MSNIVIDFERWSVKDFESFQEATRNQDIEQQVTLMVQAITAWGFEVPVSYDALLDLPYTVIEAIASVFGETFQTMLNEPVKDAISVDLSGVKVKQFLKYQKAVSNFDLEPIWEMIKLTTNGKIKTVDELRNLDVETFFSYIRAISQAFTDKQNSKKS